MAVDRLPRRAALKTLGVAAVAAAAACTAPAARSEDKKVTTSDFKWPYEKVIETDSDAKAVMASPSLSNVSIYFVQADNWLRSMERDYKYDPAKIRLVMANYGPMDFITYNDSIWSTYKAGEWQQVNDPQTKQPATRNPFVAEIKKLQDRQCVFLT